MYGEKNFDLHTLPRAADMRDDTNGQVENCTFSRCFDRRSQGEVPREWLDIRNTAIDKLLSAYLSNLSMITSTGSLKRAPFWPASPTISSLIVDNKIVVRKSMQNAP